MTPDLAMKPGFADAPRDAQAVFRAVMDALARPTSVQALATALQPPAPLTAELAAIALTLADQDAPIWLDPPLAGSRSVVAYLRFHTGAPIVADPGEAAFALVVDSAGLPPFEAFAIGTEEYPDRSTTLIIAVERLDGPAPIVVEGPGLAAPATIAPKPLPSNFCDRLAANNALFPRGLDLVFTAPGQIAALPRSSRSSERR